MSKQEYAKHKTRTSSEVQSTSKSELALACHAATFFKTKSSFTLMKDGSTSLTCLVNYCESIEEYIRKQSSNVPDPKKHGHNNSKSSQKKISQAFCVNLLLKVTHCLQQMSENKVDHVQVNPSCVYLCSDKKQMAIGDGCVNPKPKDHQFLAKLFLFVLSEGRITDRIPHCEKMKLSELERRPSKEELERRPSKEELDRRPSKEELERRPNKKELERRPSKEKLEKRPSKEELEKRSSKEDLEKRSSKEELERRPSKEQLEGRPSKEEDVNASNFLSVLLDSIKGDNQNNLHFDTLGGFLQCQEPALALDLIIKLCSEDCDYNAVLSHPFFWPPYKKCQFLCAVFCKVKDEKKSGYDEKAEEKLKDDYQMIGKEVLPQDGWVAKLKISDDNVSEINKRKNIVNVQTVEAKAKNYKTHSLFDFLRFFRNCYSHIWDDGEAIKHAFRGDSVGLWNFFASRYPRILHYVYSKTWEDLRKSNVEFHCFEECAPEPRFLSG